jgi:hypothetical protein
MSNRNFWKKIPTAKFLTGDTVCLHNPDMIKEDEDVIILSSEVVENPTGEGDPYHIRYNCAFLDDQYCVFQVRENQLY